MDSLAYVLIRIPDVLDFDRKCDGSLPLEDMIFFDPALRELFEDIDRSKARVWALTNAYRPVRSPNLTWFSADVSSSMRKEYLTFSSLVIW
jgi:hypothetical protein